MVQGRHIRNQLRDQKQPHKDQRVDLPVPVRVRQPPLQDGGEHDDAPHDAAQGPPDHHARDLVVCGVMGGKKGQRGRREWNKTG